MLAKDAAHNNPLFSRYYAGLADKKYSGRRIFGALLISLGAYVITLTAAITLVHIFFPSSSNPASGQINNNWEIFALTIGYFIFLPLLFGLIYWWTGLSPAVFGVHRPKQYLWGAIIGIFILTIPLLISVFTGSNVLSLNLGKVSIGQQALVLLLFICQGAQEEIICRALLFMSLAKKLGVTWSLIISSAIFSVAHFFNPSISYISALNIFLYGAAMALLYFYSQNLLLVCAIHSLWNYVQIAIYDFPVSGLVFNGLNPFFSNHPQTTNLINGGNFGLEGSLVTSIVLCGLMATTYWFYEKRATRSGQIENRESGLS